MDSSRAVTSCDMKEKSKNFRKKTRKISHTTVVKLREMCSKFKVTKVQIQNQTKWKVNGEKDTRKSLPVHVRCKVGTKKNMKKSGYSSSDAMEPELEWKPQI